MILRAGLVWHRAMPTLEPWVPFTTPDSAGLAFHLPPLAWLAGELAGRRNAGSGPQFLLFTFTSLYTPLAETTECVNGWSHNISSLYGSV